MCWQRVSRRVTGALVALVLALSGGDSPKPQPAAPKPPAPGLVVVQGGETFTESAEEILSQSFKVGARSKAVVDIFTGPITVTAGADRPVSVTVRASSGEVEIRKGK